MYYEYVGTKEETDKEELLDLFKIFLRNPKAFGGAFMIRWDGNDTLQNTVSMKTYASHCLEGGAY